MRIYVYMNIYIYMSTYLDVVNVVTQKWDRTVTEQVQFTTHVVGSYHQMVRLGVATLWQSGTQTWLEKFPASHVWSVDRKVFVYGGFHKFGYPKWMVYRKKSYETGWFGGTPISGKPHMYILNQVLVSIWQRYHHEWPTLCFEHAIFYLRMKKAGEIFRIENSGIWWTNPAFRMVNPHATFFNTPYVWYNQH